MQGERDVLCEVLRTGGGVRPTKEEEGGTRGARGLSYVPMPDEEDGCRLRCVDHKKKIRKFSPALSSPSGR